MIQYYIVCVSSGAVFETYDICEAAYAELGHEKQKNFRGASVAGY